MCLGDGLVTSTGHLHKQQRKIFQAPFSYRHIQDLYPVLWSKTHELLQALAEEAHTKRSNVVDIQDWVSRVALDIVGMGGFGVDLQAITKRSSSFLTNYRKVFNPPSNNTNTGPIFATLLPLWFIKALPMEQVKDILRAVSTVRRKVRSLIAAQSEKLQSNHDKNLGDNGILQVAMRSNTFTQLQTIDHAMTFMMAGHATTAWSITAAMMYLSRDPFLQGRLRQEIRTHLLSPSSNEPLRPSDINSMALLSAVCNEALRFLPFVHSIGRAAASDNSTILGHRVPKGTNLIIPVPLLNRHRDYWSGTPYDPAEFHPERWLKEEDGASSPSQSPKVIFNGTGGATSPYAMNSFGRGPKSCIGEKLGRAEMAVVLAGLIGRFEILFQGASGKGRPLRNCILDMAWGLMLLEDFGSRLKRLRAGRLSLDNLIG
jgi:cytochrome P450